MSFSYAEPASGPSAGGIGWVNFGNLSISPGDRVTGFAGTLRGGNRVTFDLSLMNISGRPRTFTAGAVPSAGDALFGRANYTDLWGNVALSCAGNLAGAGASTLTVSNIRMVDENGDRVPEFTVILADADTTGAGEAWNYQTNAGAWQLLATLGDEPPALTGLGTQDATMMGTRPFVQGAYLLSTQTPSRLILTATELGAGRQAVAIGFATTRIRLQKYVAWRMDESDQFVLDLQGVAYGQASTYIPRSLVVSAPAAGDPTTGISLTNPIAPGETVAASFQVVAAAMPNPNPIENFATAAFSYGKNSGVPDSERGSAQSNTVVIPVFRNNFKQPVNDVIHSVAQQQAALAAITSAEGSKIQRIAAMPEVTPEELVCLNRSTTDMIDSITVLEAILKQKLNILKCQISGEFC